MHRKTYSVVGSSEHSSRKKSLGPENRTGLVAVAVLAITVILLIITRIVTSYDQTTPLDPIEIKDYGPSHESSQHEVGVLVGKAPQPASNSVESIPYESVLGTVKPKKIAVILETRPLSHLLPLILHFSSVLGPEWPIYLYTPPSVVEMLQKSAAFNRSIEDGRVEIRGLPIGVVVDYPFHNPVKRARFLTGPWFWESLMPAEHVLLFGADSMICSKSELSIDDFLKYDFIGAPITGEDPDSGLEEILGVSGTLSLRNRNAMVNVAWKTSWAKSASSYRDAGGLIRKPFEHEWYWDLMTTVPILVKGREWATLPTLEVASFFAVGDVWADEPFGYDGALAKHADRKDDILKWCPEYGMSLLSEAEEERA
ncbi:hypothetical protein N431DRAFT_460492 [Stipitochalara longipes BDJ]|nr:hypothetical protein N431DRAFT_460492 [Stipitochalara longipes BDJ]